MPMDRSRYPENWDAIAQATKEAANWHCEHCKKPCRRPGQSWPEFALERINIGWHVDLDKPQQWTLTVAHLDQDPSNNDPANLKALCSICHLEHDRPHRLANRRRKLERAGQLNLLEAPQLAPVPAGQGKDPSRIQPPLWGGSNG